MRPPQSRRRGIVFARGTELGEKGRVNVFVFFPKHRAQEVRTAYHKSCAVRKFGVDENLRLRHGAGTQQ